MLLQFCTYLIDPRTQKLPGRIGFFFFNYFLFLTEKVSQTPQNISNFLQNREIPKRNFCPNSSNLFFSELDAYEQRVAEVARLVDQLPEPHKRMLEILCCHLEKVAAKSYKNMMTVGNLGVCFGPTLLRDEEETVAAIMDIKFANVVVEILVENWRQILLGKKNLKNIYHIIPI